MTKIQVEVDGHHKVLWLAGTTTSIIACRSMSLTEYSLGNTLENYLSIPPLNVYIHSALGALYYFETVFITEPTNDLRL